MIGFIGVGNLGGALARGLIAAGTPASDVVVSAAHVEVAKKFAEETGARAAATNPELVDAAGHDGIVIVAVEPGTLAEVLDEIRDVAAENHTVIVSVAAGRSLEMIAEHLSPKQPIIRVLPNVAAAVGESMTGMARGEAVKDWQFQAAREIFEAIGRVEEIRESQFAAYTALAGCSPAYGFVFMDALSRAGVKNGIPKAQASRIVAQALFGAAKMALESEKPLADLAASVQSPGGSTVAGVVEMELRGLGGAVVAGAQASIDKDKSL